VTFLGENIEDFLNKYKTQNVLWNKLTNKMKTMISEKEAGLLTPAKVITKFNTLRKYFKIYFYKDISDDEKNRNFVHYSKLNQMFNDYAIRHLNNTQPSFHEFDEMESSQYISDFIKSNIFESGSDQKENEHLEHPEPSKLRTYSKVMNGTKQNSTEININNSKLQNMLADKKSVAIHRTLMRIDMNTPFNRNVKNSTILNQRASLSYQASKRNLEYDHDYNVKKYVKIVKSTPHLNTSENDEYFVEALDECELSEILMQRSSTIQIHNVEVMKQKGNATSNNSQSIVEVPSLHPIADISDIQELRAAKSTSDLYEILDASHDLHSQTMGVEKDVVPKRLNMSDKFQDSNHVTLMKINESEEAPMWFKGFMEKYNADMRRVEAKLNFIAKALSSKTK
jgi:hypothetical protein